MTEPGGKFAASHTEEKKEGTTERVDGTALMTRMQLEAAKKLRKSVDKLSCSLCNDGCPDSVLMECGHAGICLKCAVRLLQANSRCPLCREKVGLVLRIDLKSRFGDFVRVVAGVDRNMIQQQAKITAANGLHRIDQSTNP